MEGFDERVDLPATARIKELIEEGLSPEEIIMRGFSFEKVTEALKMAHNKVNLPEKICIKCNRSFA